MTGNAGGHMMGQTQSWMLDDGMKGQGDDDDYYDDMIYESMMAMLIKSGVPKSKPERLGRASQGARVGGHPSQRALGLTD